jgi:predicted 2-oxoglutarate/Fe(II)-dependent dioxygenase YbiX
MLVVPFMSKVQCRELIELADMHGGWESLAYDKFPAQEIRVNKISADWSEAFNAYWDGALKKLLEAHWQPLLMYGLRDAFVMKYTMDTQRGLALHTDASLVTGSVKLNDDYEGAELVFPRQGFSNKDIPVGHMILFPGQVTHGHRCEELKSGAKYSLTFWTKRFNQDAI